MKKQGRGFIWTTEEEQKLKEEYNNGSLQKLVMLFNRPERAIRAKALKMGLSRDLTKNEYNRAWAEQEEKYLKENYYDGNLLEIAKKLNRTKKAVSERAKILKITRNTELVRLNGHKYTINENFFKTWSDEMAYILGLIWTDGCMLDTNYSICITQHKKDKYILDNIYDVLGSNNKPYKNKNTYNIAVCNKIIYEDLKQLGLTPRKSKTIKMPNNLPDKFATSFIRGVLDGDGSVSTKKTMVKLSTASKYFAEGLCELLSKLNIKYKIYNESYVWKNGKNLRIKDQVVDDIKTDFFNIKILRKKYLKKLYHLIYDNTNLYLKRKKQAFIDMGIEQEDFAVKNKHIMRKIERLNPITQERIQFNQIKEIRKDFPRIFAALKSEKMYKGYIWKYVE